MKLAGLLELDKGALLGALLMAADRLGSEEWAANAKRRGDALLPERADARKAVSQEPKRQERSSGNE